jgi:macrolide transport system ATP-binding/permease protein
VTTSEQALIALKGVSRVFASGTSSITVLNNITLEVAAGEMVAIMGTSGSGKSTLMNIIGCLDVATSGELCIDGQNTAQLSADALAALRREHIGFIFQRYHLMPDISALANVEIPAIYANVSRINRRERASALLSSLGLAGREHHRPGQLSGGQQQRVSICRALINGGEIILADEPTGALDSTSGQEVLQILNELHQLGHTVIIVTHDINVARQAQRVITLRDGEVVSDTGKHAPNPATLPKKTSERQSHWQRGLERAQNALLMALKAMNAHRLRTLLTMAGIIFGIAAVVTVAALGEGAKQKTLEEIEGLGANVITLFPGDNFYRTGPLVNPVLRVTDAEAIAALNDVDGVSPEISDTKQVVFRQQTASSTVTGVGRDYFRINGIEILQGTVFQNDRSALQEGVIDENLRNILFPKDRQDPLGQVIYLGVLPVRIVGVASSYKHAPPNASYVWIPYSTVFQRMSAQQTLGSISVKLKDSADSVAAVEAIKRLLVQRHGAKDFMIFNQDQYRKSRERTSTIFSLLILMVAAISLTIGSLGVMNIMLVSVTERTHEIGVRMAVGARRSDIMQQFIVEAVLVCITGGVLGIALSLAVGPLFNTLGNGALNAIFSWQTAAIAFCCSTLIGMIFGYLPAHKAARMDPVISLASE